MSEPRTTIIAALLVGFVAVTLTLIPVVDRYINHPQFWQARAGR